MDRGPDTQKLYRWTRKLTEQAKEQGGKVVKLWGYARSDSPPPIKYKLLTIQCRNHEFMNAMYDWRYVDQGDLESFPVPHEQKRMEAFSLQGSIGSDWMLDYGVTYLDPTMKAHFMHAGLDYQHAVGFNESLGIGFMEKLLAGQRHARQWSTEEHDFWSGDGPMWYRGYALLSEEEACKEASKVLGELDADFLVMGHTPTFEHAVVRCGGHVVLIDTGLSAAYGGRPVVLEMRKKKTGDIDLRLHYDDIQDREVVEVIPLAW